MPVPSEPELLARIRGEYREMPGLCLTGDQACRLWQIDTTRCLGLLEHLVEEGILYRRPDGAYCGSPAVRSRAVTAVRIERSAVRRPRQDA